ncbi:hypothetical protein [Paracoccus sp. KR1-242]|uniref:hypothetical protein n=1 Tax=Paracoccus sp. KR1-242 TaxID=3410028 RepID=UPI003C0DA96F
MAYFVAPNLTEDLVIDCGLSLPLFHDDRVGCGFVASAAHERLSGFNVSTLPPAVIELIIVKRRSWAALAFDFCHFSVVPNRIEQRRGGKDRPIGAAVATFRLVGG